MTDDERPLVYAALRWARGVGVTRLADGRGRRRWMWLSKPSRTGERTVVSLHGENMFVHRPGRRVCLVGVTSASEALSVLACLRVIPARFSTLGGDALDDWAAAGRRFAVHQLQHWQDGDAAAITRAAAWFAAADSARRMGDPPEVPHAA